MSSIDAAARDWVERMQRSEVARSWCSLPTARKTIARRLGMAPGTIENILRGRTKGLRGWMIERIRSAVIKELNSEIARATHELQMARQCGLDPHSPQVDAAEAAIREARRLINGQ